MFCFFFHLFYSAYFQLQKPSIYQNVQLIKDVLKYYLMKLLLLPQISLFMYYCYIKVKFVFFWIMSLLKQ